MDQQQQRYSEWVQLFLKYIRERTLPLHVQQDEGYKFQAVSQFLNTFNIDDTDLAGNLDAALQNNNLVSGAMYFPKKMLLQYARLFPDQTREALRTLFDQTQDVSERITTTQKRFLEIEKLRSQHLGEPVANTYIGLRFLSLLLGYMHPNLYNPLKPAEWKVFARFIDPDFSMPRHTPAGEQYTIYDSYIEPLRRYIMERPEFVEIRAALTHGQTFHDTEYRWVTQDVIFVTARVYADTRSAELEASLPRVTNEDGGAEPFEVSEDALNTGFMPLEKHLEEYVIKNWDNINFGEKLHMYLDEDGTTGQQYTTDVGIIDILAQDEHDDFVVIELKRAEYGYQVVGQVLNYMGWVQDKLAKDGQKVRGLVIVGKADKALLSALKPVKDLVSLKEYRVQMYLEDADA